MLILKNMKKFTHAFLFLIISSALFSTVNSQSEQKPNPAALVAMTKGQFREAIRILDADIQDNKNLFASYKFRSDLRRMTGNFQGAFEDVDQAIQLVSNEGSLYQRRSELRMILNPDMKLILADLDLAIANGVKHEKIYASRGMIRGNSGDLDGAISDYETSIAMHPGYPQAYVGLANTYSRKPDEEKEVQTLEDFIATIENSGKKTPVVKGTVTASKTVDIPQLSNDKIRVGQSTEIIVGESRSAGPPSPEQMERITDRLEQSKNTALAYIQLASAYEKRGDYEKAMATVEKGIAIDPTDFYGLETRGKIKIGIGDYSGSLADLDKAIKMMPRIGTMYLSRGIAYLMLGKDVEAQKDFDMFIQIYPKGKPEMDRRIESARKAQKL